MDLERIVREYYRCLCHGDRETMLALVDPGIVHEFNQGSVQVGIEDFAKFLAIKEKHYRENIEDLFVWSDAGTGRAAAEFTLKGNYVQTYPGLPEACGQPYEIRVGGFFDCASGKIRRVTTYFNFETWLAQISGN